MKKGIQYFKKKTYSKNTVFSSLDLLKWVLINLQVGKHTLNNVLFHILDGNKRRHQLRKKIAAEKRALEDAITKRNAVMEETDKLPPPNELLAEENYSWPWECKYIRHVYNCLHILFAYLNSNKRI